MKTLEDIKTVIRFAFNNDIDLLWSVDDETDEIQALVNVNDVFYWGCSDAEQVEAEDVPAFQQAIDDVGNDYGWEKDLYAARKRGMRPQGAIINAAPAYVRKLLMEAGPVREVDFANPKEIEDETHQS